MVPLQIFFVFEKLASFANVSNTIYNNLIVNIKYVNIIIGYILKNYRELQKLIALLDIFL